MNHKGSGVGLDAECNKHRVAFSQQLKSCEGDLCNTWIVKKQGLGNSQGYEIT